MCMLEHSSAAAHPRATTFEWQSQWQIANALPYRVVHWVRSDGHSTPVPTSSRTWQFDWQHLVWTWTTVWVYPRQKE